MPDLVVAKDSAPVAPGAFRERLPELVLVLVTLVWGGTFLGSQLALRESGPFAFVAMRFTVGAAVLFLLFARRMRGLGRAEILAGAGIGVATFLSYAMQTAGLLHITSSRSAFITALYVPVVPLLQLLLLRKAPRASAWAGIGISFGGLLVLSTGEGATLALGVGEWLTLGGAVMAALQIVLVSRWAPQADPMRLAFVQMAVVAALAAVSVPLAGETIPVLTPTLALAVAGMGILGTAFALAAMSWAQATVSPTRATVIYAMEPVWAGVAGALAGEAMTGTAVGGSALVVLGVLASELRWPTRKRRLRTASATRTEAGEAVAAGVQYAA